MSTMRPLAAAFCALALSSCAGYQLDGAKPAVLSGVESIAIPMVSSKILHPRAEALATSAAAEALVLDGTYELGTTDASDAVLDVTIEEIRYDQIRATRLDTLRPEELQSTVTFVWTLRENGGQNQVLASGASVGRSRLFTDSNLQTSRNNALPDAFDRASEAMISRLANGY